MIYNDLLEKIDSKRIFKNEKMSKHTSFKVGGIADFYVVVEDVDELIYVLELGKKNNIETFIIGNGTNLIVTDKGFRGIVIKLNFSKLELENDVITAGAGVSLITLSHFALKNNICNYEFMSGIPGTIGGGVKMNAGAYGGEIKDILVSTKYLDENYEVKELNNNEHEFDYRYSIFFKENWIILESKFKTELGKYDDIKAKMDEFTKSRKEKQPLDKPSAGSTFKRGEDFITAKVIDDLGLKGYKIGGAMVSEKHAGFIVNDGDACAKDILDLIDFIKKKAKDELNKELKLEVLIIGEK